MPPNRRPSAWNKAALSAKRLALSLYQADPALLVRLVGRWSNCQVAGVAAFAIAVASGPKWTLAESAALARGLHRFGPSCLQGRSRCRRHSETAVSHGGCGIVSAACSYAALAATLADASSWPALEDWSSGPMRPIPQKPVPEVKS